MCADATCMGIGVEAVYHCHFAVGLLVTSIVTVCAWARGGTLNAGVCGNGVSCTIDIVMLIGGADGLCSALEAGCIIRTADVLLGLSVSTLLGSCTCVRHCMSLRSCYVPIYLRPLTALAQLASVCMSLSCDVTVGFMVSLCYNWTVSLNRSLLVSLMWHLWVQ